MIVTGTWCFFLNFPWIYSPAEEGLLFKYGIIGLFIFLDSKITVDNDCSHEIKRLLLFRKKAMTHLDSILRSRDITLLTKAYIVKGMVFLVVMYECEKSEHQRTDAFEL